TSYELSRIASAATNSTTMPTMAMRQGDFSGLVDTTGRQSSLYDPYSTGVAPTWQRTPFPSNQIPAARESPEAKYLYSVMPVPTNGANPLVASNYFGLGSSYTSDYMSTTRLDHRVGERDQVFGRFSINQDNQTTPNGVPATNLSMNTAYNLNRATNGVGHWTHTFSPMFLSETQVS